MKGLHSSSIPIGAFEMWKAFAGTSRDIPVAGLLALSFLGSLMSPLDVAAYHAPFTDERCQAGVRRSSRWFRSS